MSTAPITRTIVIRNPQGLHARPAQQLVQLASKYESQIELVRDNQRVDAKSIFSLLTLAAVQGTTLVLEVQGKDAEAAADAIIHLVEEGFEDEESGDEEATD